MFFGQADVVRLEGQLKAAEDNFNLKLETALFNFNLKLEAGPEASARSSKAGGRGGGQEPQIEALLARAAKAEELASLRADLEAFQAQVARGKEGRANRG